MSRKKSEQQTSLEIILVLICLALCGLLYRVGPYRTVVLNLFYLPVVLAAFYLGRYRAGILALLCVICAAVITALDLNTLAAFTSPLAVGLALTIWGAVMGINSLLVGTLSDERTDKIKELHDAYVGVVEVLARYLNSSDPKVCDRTAKVAQLSQEVAAQMRLIGQGDRRYPRGGLAPGHREYRSHGESHSQGRRRSCAARTKEAVGAHLSRQRTGSILGVGAHGGLAAAGQPRRVPGPRRGGRQQPRRGGARLRGADHPHGAGLRDVAASRPVDESPRGARMRWKTVLKAIIIRP